MSSRDGDLRDSERNARSSALFATSSSDRRDPRLPPPANSSRRYDFPPVPDQETQWTPSSHHPSIETTTPFSQHSSTFAQPNSSYRSRPLGQRQWSGMHQTTPQLPHPRESQQSQDRHIQPQQQQQWQRQQQQPQHLKQLYHQDNVYQQQQQQQQQQTHEQQHSQQLHPQFGSPASTRLQPDLEADASGNHHRPVRSQQQNPHQNSHLHGSPRDYDADQSAPSERGHFEGPRSGASEKPPPNIRHSSPGSNSRRQGHHSFGPSAESLFSENDDDDEEVDDMDLDVQFDDVLFETIEKMRKSQAAIIKHHLAIELDGQEDDGASNPAHDFGGLNFDKTFQKSFKAATKTYREIRSEVKTAAALMQTINASIQKSHDRTSRDKAEPSTASNQ